MTQDRIEVDYKLGESTLEINNKSVLKGTFSYMSALTQKFVELYQQHEYPLDELAGAYIWSCHNVKDANEQVFNIIEQFQRTPIFSCFALDGFISGGDFYIGKLLFSALIIPYFEQYTKLTKSSDITRLINILTNAYRQLTGVYQQVLANAIWHITKLQSQVAHETILIDPSLQFKPICITKPQNNPFNCVFRSVKLGQSETIDSEGKTLIKASIARFLHAVGESAQTGELNDEMINLIHQALPTLIEPKFAFFEFFTDPNEWLKESNLAKIYTFAQYLKHIKSDPNKREYYIYANECLQKTYAKLSADTIERNF